MDATAPLRPAIVDVGTSPSFSPTGAATWHQFRHTMAHRWLADGQQEQDLMRLAGWRSWQSV